MSSEGEDANDDRPSRLNILGLRSADLGNTHDYVFFNLRPCREVVHHNGFKRLQEVLLEIEALELRLQ